MLNIVLEGENKTGKSTLAKLLVKKYGFQYVKCSQPKGDPYVEYMRKINAIKKPTVFDRMYIGENVYGPIYRGKSMLSPEQNRNLEMALMSKNTVVIYCSDSAKNIRSRFSEEQWADEKKIEQVLALYEKVLDDVHLPIYDHMMETVQDLTLDPNLLERIFERYDNDYIVDNHVMGNTYDPTLILVGDKVNTRQKYADLARPFAFGPAGKFLYKALDNARISLRDVLILNSDNKKVLSELQDLFMVALGNNASKALVELGIYHVKLNHPQYESRFKRKNNKFAQQLKSAYEHTQKISK